MFSHAQVGATRDVNVTQYDAYGNMVSSGYSGTVHFTSTDNAADLPSDAAFTTGFYNNVTFIRLEHRR